MKLLKAKFIHFMILIIFLKTDKICQQHSVLQELSKYLWLGSSNGKVLLLEVPDIDFSSTFALKLFFILDQKFEFSGMTDFPFKKLYFFATYVCTNRYLNMYNYLYM